MRVRDQNLIVGPENFQAESVETLVQRLGKEAVAVVSQKSLFCSQGKASRNC
jgi:hypothetical protein